MLRAAGFVNMLSTKTVNDDLSSIDAEQAALGGLLVSNDVLDDGPTLTPAAFTDPLHAQIFERITAIRASGRRASPITLKQAYVGSPDIVDGVSVATYLVRLVAAAPPAPHVRQCAEHLVDLADRRRLIAAIDAVRSDLHRQHDVPAAAIMEALEAEIGSIAEHRDPARSATLGEAVAAAVDSVNAAMMRGGHVAGLSTGLIDLDRRLGGLARSDLVILAGRPGMGKTALAVSIADAVARTGVVTDDGEHVAGAVGIFSMEMSGQQLAHRLLAAEAGFDGFAMRRGQLRRADGLSETGERGERDTEIQMDRFRLLRDAADRLSARPVVIDETGGLSIQQLSARARRMARKHRLQLIVIDYLQLMRSSKYGGRNAELTEITTGLKALAKELDIPIIALSQLSRAVENRPEKRPQLSDLRESGAIEQDADVVLFVYREEYYLERAKPASDDLDALSEYEAKLTAARGKAEVIIGKQRHGPLGIVNVAFDAPTVRFHNLHQGADHDIAA